MSGSAERPGAVSGTGPRPSLATCPSCGGVAVAGLPFCPSCGKRLKEAEPGRACPRCGTLAPDNTKYCPACGMGLDQPRRSSGSGGRPASAFALAVVDETGKMLSRHPLSTGETTVGREGADLAFPEDPFLSPLHVKFTIRDAECTARDLGSRNGTWVFIADPHRLADGDRILVGSQVLLYRRLGYPGPHPPERDATRRMGSLVPSADIARLTQLRSDGSERDAIHLSPGRSVVLGREHGDWVFPYDPSMSGTHAEIRSEDADFVVVDRESRNGVAVAARGNVALPVGTRLLIGDKLLRVETA